MPPEPDPPAPAAPAPSRRAWWLAAALLLVLVPALYRHYDLGRLLTVATLQASRDALAARVHDSPAAAAAAFFAIYLAAAALSIPGAVILTLAAGAMFGLATGVALVALAASLGALLSFLAARYLLRDLVQARFGRQLAPVNEGMRRDGAFYLLSLRLVPLFPFFLVNLLAGLTPIAAGRYYAVSLLGMLPATFVFVNAGTQLARIRNASDVLSPTLLASFALLGCFPLLARAIVAASRRRRVYARWPRPRHYDRNLVVIGAGSGGLVAAYIAAAVKASVTLVESGSMGGDCLNTGCVPSKALIRSARLAHEIRGAAALGIAPAGGEVDFAAVMARVRRVVAAIAPHDSAARYRALGVDVAAGHARITSPWTVEIRGADGVRTLCTRSIVIATGAVPVIPDIPGLAAVGCLTSETVWGLTARPARLVVLGGGPVGCELAQSFARLGSQVTQIELSAQLLGREDADVAALVQAALQDDGVQVLTGHEALRVECDGGRDGGRDGMGKRIVVRGAGGERAIEFDELLCAVGRRPRVSGFGLEELGIPLSPHHTVQTDAWLQTLYPNIYAVGDVAGPFQFTHTASHQAWYAAVNALFGRFKRFKVDDSVIPRATFTDPEAARVGLSEGEARAQGVAFEVARYDLADLDRAIADNATRGFVKVLTVPGRDRILGVTIVGEHAADLLAEYVLAMKHGIGLKKILGTIHTYPTLAEANKAVAGAWQRAHLPQALLAWSRRYHAWQLT